MGQRGISVLPSFIQYHKICVVQYISLLVILIILPQHIYINPIMIIQSLTCFKLAVICIADIYRIIIKCIGKDWHHPSTSSSFKKKKTHKHETNLKNTRARYSDLVQAQKGRIGWQYKTSFIAAPSLFLNDMCCKFIIYVI